VYFLQRRPVGDAVQVVLAAYATDSLTAQWTAPLLMQPPATRNAWTGEVEDPLLLAIAVTGDRVYTAVAHWKAPEPVAVIALSRADGAEAGRWAIDAGRAVSNIALHAAPDGRELYLFAYTLAALEVGTPAQESYIRLRPSNGHQERRVLSTARGITPFLFSPSARITPDGLTLYDISEPMGASNEPIVTANERVVWLFDLITGTVEPALPLPFRLGQDEELVTQTATANDGRTLYVLAPALGTLAIVDLEQRRVDGVRTLGQGDGPTAASLSLRERAWKELRRLVTPAALAKPRLNGGMQLAPDGRRLYAAGLSGPVADRTSGVLVIDTSTWRVVERWLPAAAPTRLLLSGDGRTLYLFEHEGEEANVAVGRLRGLDTTTGATVFDTVLRGTWITSLADLYRERYGRWPPTGTSRPGG
jgi:hypothetical protein